MLKQASFFSRVSFRLVISLGAALVIASSPLACGEDAAEEGSEGEPTGTTCPPNSTLTYDNFGKAFMEKYCTDCHSASVTGAARKDAPTTVNFDTAARAVEHRALIDRVAGAGPNAVNSFMPPEDPKPTEAERRQLAEWTACGSP